jgi:hypothetical protein
MKNHSPGREALPASAIPAEILRAVCPEAMNKKSKKVVVGEYSEWGYEVQIIRGSRMLHSYAAGNHKQDSQQRAALGSPEACGLRQIRRDCIRTARDIAQEHRAQYGGVTRQTQKQP